MTQNVFIELHNEYEWQFKHTRYKNHSYKYCHTYKKHGNNKIHQNILGNRLNFDMWMLAHADIWKVNILTNLFFVQLYSQHHPFKHEWI